MNLDKPVDAARVALLRRYAAEVYEALTRWEALYDLPLEAAVVLLGERAHVEAIAGVSSRPVPFVVEVYTAAELVSALHRAGQGRLARAMAKEFWRPELHGGRRALVCVADGATVIRWGDAPGDGR